MAANFTVKVKCSICGTENTITDTNESTNGSVQHKEDRYQCSKCGVIFPISFSSIAVEHSGSIGANTVVTHTMATPGSISSAVS